ncbi:hypothetical protein A1O3_09459 [Capronia epimyces CBS 606.96]|uniref:DUF202 domain-containing protein n=1 Tax=Capronia epimyces CBS 606.96 TaxID=1182542 RepID=W9XDJ9_9EURO|nr:uncharacterized protein A1O3_09459 [Capronia epimyces CBS 606.96]EXJ78298.1 hypothetical protein A1O3_09459 [Capronia epimyces CBS 606.96]
MKLLFRRHSTNAIAESKNRAALGDCVPMTQLPGHAAASAETTGPDLSNLDKEKSHSGAVSEGTWILKKLWIKYVSLDIPQSSNRNHFSNEQTFLAWLSLADAIAILGVVIAQVSRIQHVLRPHQEKSLRYLLLGKPQACLCYASACFVLLVGAYRFFRQQNAMNQGFALVGGLSLPCIGVLVGMCLAAFFLLLILVGIAGVHS